MEECSQEDTLECGHILCQECLSNLRTAKCPVCRADLRGSSVNDIILQMIEGRTEYDRQFTRMHDHVVSIITASYDFPETNTQAVADGFDVILEYILSNLPYHIHNNEINRMIHVYIVRIGESRLSYIDDEAPNIDYHGIALRLKDVEYN